MWASRPSYHDNEGPIDLRKKVVLQRDLEEKIKTERTSAPTVFRQKENLVISHHPPPTERWRSSPVTPGVLPVGNLYPFMSERYGSRCSVVNSNPEENSRSQNGSRGPLETAIRKLHNSSRLKKPADFPREERCRSIDPAHEKSREKKQKGDVRKVKRSSSCPNLTVIEPPKPSPIKPKSTFIQRSFKETLENHRVTSGSDYKTNYYQDLDEHSNSQTIGGAKKRKSFVPVYGECNLSPKRRPNSPIDSMPYEDYFSHPEILLRRQLQQHNPSPYLVHVYDYYQQLVQRLRDHSSPVHHLPPPSSPQSADDELAMDGQRKRPCRALTGKHVRQGTGASLSTLLTLRQKIQERQKAREHEPFNGNCNKNLSPKKMKNQRSKQNTNKSALHKIQNC